MFQETPSANPIIETPTKPKKRVKRTVVPKKVLDAMKRYRWERQDTIRLRRDAMEFCPLTWAAFQLTGALYHSDNFRAAAKRIHISMETAELIADAADGVLECPSKRLIKARQELLKTARLITTTAMRKKYSHWDYA